MAAGTFTITELRRTGSRTVEELGREGKFEWTADRTPPDPSRGGARAAPKGIWELAGQLRTVRTDYPGAKTPSEQVLGPNHQPFTLTGKWDDRYNFEGYAVEEMRRFEALCRRGNLVRVQFQNQVFECLITDWKFNYRRAWEIVYSFTVSVHDRPDDFDITDRSPNQPKSATEAAQDLDLYVTGMEQLDLTTDLILATTLRDTTKSGIGSIRAQTDGINSAIDQRELGIFSDNPGRSAFGYLASRFRAAQTAAFNLGIALAEVRSDTEAGANTVMNILNFEDYTRSLKFSARLAMGSAITGASDMQERDTPDAVRLYRPFKGEHLYAISRRFYGTPHSWRFIADRNGLTDFEMTGEELLIIPERGE